MFHYLLVILFLSFNVLTPNSEPLTWRQITSNSQSPPPLELPGLGFYAARNQIILFGGRGSSGYSNALWICTLQPSANNTETCDWVRVFSSTTPPPSRFSMVSGVYEKEGLFIIATGEGSGRTHYNDIWYYDLTGSGEWTEVMIEGGRPSVRYGAVGGIHHEGNLFSVSHGFARAGRTSDTFVLNVTELRSNTMKRWLQAAGPYSSYIVSGPHPRCLAAGTMISPTVLIMYGGCLNSPSFGAGGPCPSYDSWRIDFTQGVWERLPDCISPRFFVAMSYLANDTAVLFAGNPSGLHIPSVASGPIIPEEIDVVDLRSSNKWTRRSASSLGGNYPIWRERHSMTTGNDTAYMFGGRNFFTDERLNDLWSIQGRYVENNDIGCPNHFFTIPMMHGILMFLGWGVFLQAGAFIARYLRFKAPLWFHLHRIFQITGLGIAILGFILGFFQTSIPLFLHAAFGIIIMIIGIQQPINGIFRPHIKMGEKPTLRRIIWSYFHIYSGRFALILAIVNISLGFFLILAPSYIWGLWFAMLIGLAILYIVFETIKQINDFQTRKKAKESPKGIALENNSMTSEEVRKEETKIVITNM